LPPKRKIKPAVKMKKFHWAVHQPRVIPNTLWKDVDDQSVEFDIKDLESIFGEKKREKRKEGDEKKASKKSRPAKQKSVELFDKRSTNVAIALSRFHMTHEAIRDSLIAMDEKALDLDKLEMLQRCIPEPDEMTVVKNYEGDVDELGMCEKFFLVIDNVPRVKERVQLFTFKLGINDAENIIRPRIETCERALNVLDTSANLKKVLEVILALGNYMNGGTKSGQAYGFKLATLNKLKNSKGRNQTTLLDFLHKTLKQYYPDSLSFCEELQCCIDAMTVEYSFINGEVSKFNGMVNRIANELKKCEALDPAKDGFCNTMRPFHAEVHVRALDYKARVSAIDQKASALVMRFGEDSKMHMEDLFAIFGGFAKDYKQAVKNATALEAKRAAEAKRAEAQAAQKAARQAKKAARKSATKKVAETTDDPAAPPSTGSGVFSDALGSASNPKKLRDRMRKQRTLRMTLRKNRERPRAEDLFSSGEH
jgi:hypothetical protein